jgi:Holliday junction resolvase RusA-like endonuclease
MGGMEGRKTDVIEFTVPGRPVPAVRMTQRGKWIKRNASRYLAFKEHVGWVARQHFPEPWEGPVGIRIVAYWWGGRPGDLDNILKAIQDGLNEIAWHDDTQVVLIGAERRRDKPERTEVAIWRVEEECDGGLLPEVIATLTQWAEGS